MEGAIERMTAEDFACILREHARYWDSDLTRRLHHPIFLHEFGDTAFVIRVDGQLAAYLLAFFAQTGPVAYVHMVAVRDDFRRRGLARRLYDYFIELARARGCRSLKATAAPTNALSIRFHIALGMRMLGTDHGAGVPVVRDYLAPGVDRVVFMLDLVSPAGAATTHP